MTDITLGDYAGFIFLEMVKAREMADEYSKTVAQRYQKDPILEHFSVPRFRIPKMDITIPVLVSGASFNTSVRFKLDAEGFIELVEGELDEAVRQVLIRLGGPGRDIGKSGEATRKITLALFEELRASPAARFEGILTLRWRDVLGVGMKERGFSEEYRRADPQGDLLAGSAKRVLRVVANAVVIDKTRLENLLVNPETNVVKNGSSESSVFTIKAEMIEEGFYIRSVTDPGTQQTHTVVEFE